MAAAAAGSLVEEFSGETTCSICLDYFTDPVITDCGHNFCRACLTQHWKKSSDRNASCPHCRATVRGRNFRPNRQLANIVEITKKFSHEVAKRAETVCGTHEEPLKLFCRDDEALLCVVCDRSKEHQDHKVVPMEEAAQEYKEEIQAHLQFVKKERDTIVDQKLVEEKRSQTCLAQLKVEKQNIRSAFEKMQKLLEERELFWMGLLGDLEKEIEKRQEQNITRFSEEISIFSNLITEMERKCQQPATAFLKDIRSTLTGCQKRRAKQLIPLSPELEERLRSFSLQLSVLKNALEMSEDIVGSSADWTCISGSAPVPESPGNGLTKVVVTLDPDTANPCLALSDDQKSVTWGKSKLDLPVHSERFDCMPCVLGLEAFSSGRHWWEVGVEGLEERAQERWAVGVVTESVRRKGWFNLNPSEGVWAVGKASSPPCQVLAFTAPEETPLTLSQEPRKIQVSLDYEEGRVEFFEADTDELIFAFRSASFYGKRIHPFFLVWTEVTLKC